MPYVPLTPNRSRAVEKTVNSIVPVMIRKLKGALTGARRLLAEQEEKGQHAEAARTVARIAKMEAALKNYLAKVGR